MKPLTKWNAECGGITLSDFKIGTHVINTEIRKRGVVVRFGEDVHPLGGDLARAMRVEVEA